MLTFRYKSSAYHNQQAEQYASGSVTFNFSTKLVGVQSVTAKPNAERSKHGTVVLMGRL